MNTIFLALGNLKHDGNVIKAGEVFEGELTTFQHLVTDGVLRVVEGATSLEHAAEIIQGEVAAGAAKAESEKAAAPANTWGPAEDKPAEVAATTETTTEETKPEETASTESTTISTGEAPAVGTGDVAPAADNL